MHIVKKLLLISVGMIAVISLIIVYILGSYDSQDYKQLLVKSIDNFSDYTLSIKGRFELDRSLTPILSASKIELNSKTDDSYVSIDNFRIQITLAPLLNNNLLINDLLMENMQIKIRASEDPINSTSLISYLPVPIIEHAVLKDINLVSAVDKQTHTLDSLVIQAKHRQSPIEIYATGMFRGHEFDIEGQLGALADIYAQQTPYPVKLVANWKQAQLFINGTIANPEDGEGLDLACKVNFPDIADVFLKTTPVKGRLQGRAHIKGAFTAPMLDEIQTVLVGKPLIDMQMSGSIGNLLTREEMDLHLAGFIHDAKLLKWALPASSPSFSRFTIDTEIHKDSKDYMLQNMDVNLSNQQGLKINLTGNTHLVHQKQPFESLDIQARVSSRDTATVKPYLGNILPEMGAIQGSARITTQGKGFVLSDIDLLAGVDKKVQLTARGRAGQLESESDSEEFEMALELALKSQSSTALTSLLNIKHPEIGPISIDARLNGSVETLKLEEINLQAGHPDVFSLQAHGHLSWDKLDSGSYKQLVDVTIQAHTPLLQQASRLYGEDSPNLGSAKLSMRMHGTGMVLAGSDLTMLIGSKDRLLFKVQGKIAQIFYTDFFLKGIELKGTLAGQSTSHLAELLENSKIADIGPLTGNILIKGDSSTLNVPQISMTAGRKNALIMHASGQIAEIPLKQQNPPQGVNIELDVKAPSSADLSVLVGNQIPDLGFLSIKGLVTGNNGVLSINEFKLTTGDVTKPVISMSGTVENLLSRKGVQMNVVFDEKTLVKLFDVKPIAELGSITGSALLSNTEGSFGLKDLKLELGESELINLKVIGEVKDIANTNQVSANVEIAIKQPELLGKLFAIDLTGFNSASMSGLISGNKSRVTFKGNSLVGRSRFSSHLVFSFINQKPEISGTINSPNLFLKDFGLVSEKSTMTKKAKKQSAKSVKKPLFDETPISLQALHKVDLNLQLRIYKISDSDYKLDKVNIDLLLHNGKLVVNPVNFSFSEGQVSMNAEVATKIIPEWSLNISGDQVQLAEIFGQQDTSPPMTGRLNLAVDLNSTGVSEHEIAANLQGEFGFTIENGGINRSQLELVFLNPLGWLFSYGTNKNEIRISCGLGRYQVNEGIIKSRFFLIDGPKFLTRGRTEANLGKETINSLYHLEKKNLFDKTIVPALFNSNVGITVSGDLADPTVEQAPLNSVGARADRYLFAPVATVPRELLGTVFDIFEAQKVDQSPCKAYLE